MDRFSRTIKLVGQGMIAILAFLVFILVSKVLLGAISPMDSSCGGCGEKPQPRGQWLKSLFSRLRPTTTGKGATSPPDPGGDVQYDRNESRSFGRPPGSVDDLRRRLSA